jgi:hypothetical protein
LDLQLEFEEKLAEAEEKASSDLENQKRELDEEHESRFAAVNEDLDKHKAAIGKLNEKYQKSMDALTKARASGLTGG